MNVLWNRKWFGVPSVLCPCRNAAHQDSQPPAQPLGMQPVMVAFA